MKCLQKYLEGIGKTDWLNRSDNKGLSEPELRKKLIAEEHKRLSDNLNTLKKAVNPKTKPEKYSAPKEPETTDIEKDFENKKIELENKYSQLKKGGENAIQKREQPEGNLTEHQNRKSGGETTETSSSNSTVSSGQEQQEKITEPQGGTPPPTGEQPPLNENADEEWTAIRKEKLKEIAGVKEVFEKETGRKWTTIQQQALEDVLKEYKGKSLYEAVKAKTELIANKYDEKQDYNPTAKDLAVIQEFKRQTENKISQSKDRLNSGNDFVRNSAIIEVGTYANDLINAAKALHTREAGTAFGFRASESKMDANYGLQIRRMELMRANGGEPLSEADLKWTNEQWEKEKELMKQEQEVREQAMKDDFDTKVSELSKEYEQKLKEAQKNTTTNTSASKVKKSQQIKDIAQQIRTSNAMDKFLKGASGDIQKQGFIDIDYKELVAQALDYIAKGLEKAEDIGALIKEAASKFKDKFDESKFAKDLTVLLDRASLPKKETTLNDIKEFAKENDATDLTNEMVGKNLIRDYINSHIGEVEQKDLLDVATKDLKEVLPNVTKEKLVEAYLKEGEFKQPTKKDLEGGIAEAKKQLKSIAKLSEDIEDLTGLKEVRQRTFKTEREKSEYENKLFKEKNDKVNEITERNNKIKQDNAKLESERNRQLKKVQELKAKKENLEKGIKIKTEARQKFLDTPEIEKLKNEVKKLDSDIRAAEAAQKAAERKIESDRNKGIRKDNKMIESESIRQIKKVQELNEKKQKLENGIREKRSVQPKIDTPEIENLKAQVKEVDKNLREAESLAKKTTKDIQDKKDKIGELDANIERAKNDRDLIKTHRNKSEKQIDDEILAKQKELKKAIQDNTSDERVQQQKLDAAKKNAIKQTKEYQRKIDEGEFEEKPQVKLRKKDAELIRLKKQQSIVEEQFRKKQKELQEKNKSKLERFADFVRSSYIALLIGRPTTLLKVGAMSVMRPLSETTSKLTFGKAFDLFFPRISEAAKRGGESSSWRSIQKGFEAYFRQMGSEQLEAKYKKSESEYTQALKQYTDYKNSDNPNKQKLESLKNKVNDKLLKSTGDFIYQFIGGSSLKDALSALIHRSNEIEKQFGKVEGESIKEGNWLDKTNYLLGFIGRSHSALKTFSGRFSFAAGFMARLEAAAKEGEDISSADKVLELAHESYIDWERGKYQQSNQITDLWNKMTNHISEGEVGTPREGTAKVLAALLKTEVAITRVPVNIIHEAVMEYTLGAFKAPIMAFKAEAKAKGELIKGGLDVDAPEFKAALKEKISQMDATQAATIARCFRKGGLGAGLYAFALISGAIHFGIFPHLGQKKAKDESKLGKDELNPGQVMIGDTKLGESTSSVIEHIPALWTTFMGLGMAQAYNDELKKGKTTTQAVQKAIFTHLQIIEGNIPQSKIISPTKVGQTITQSVETRLKQMGIMSNEKPSSFTDETINKYPSLKYIRDTLNVSLPNVQYGNHTTPVKGVVEPVKISTLPQEKQDAYKDANIEAFSKGMDKVRNRGYVYVDDHDSVKETWESGYKRYYFDEEKFKKDKADYEAQNQDFTGTLMSKEQKGKYMKKIQDNIQDAANTTAKDKIFGKEYIPPTDSTKNKK